MSLTERHRWCIGKIVETYAPEVESESAQLWMRQEANLQRFTSFFRGEGSGRLFVFYQAEEKKDQVRRRAVLAGKKIKRVKKKRKTPLFCCFAAAADIMRLSLYRFIFRAPLPLF